ncbi:uncharacterized protein SCHCODRAFT_02534574 [Schizophyllum commune H4-8]|uniref:Uncharacterized protein n=1 Tax=Schizophyllum commune (strain H4-8 / FGSC 9210) TaxID=578458 RepID=D8Q2T2_SCHCM|nr:uncharacterized protein SCHCODRAFT_02534574 [Schizophyllum commune H4-8]KAI5894598.1 hypothetical protein SCHCODRAFT_02534574 [Schizophyllum commune H4-8]
MSSENLLDPNRVPLAAATHDEDQVASPMAASQPMSPSDKALTSNRPPSQPSSHQLAAHSEVATKDVSASDAKAPAPTPEVTRAPDFVSGSSSKGEHHDTAPPDLGVAPQSPQVSHEESEAPEAGRAAPVASSGGEGATRNDAGAIAHDGHVNDALLHPSEGQITAASVSGHTQSSQTPVAQDDQAMTSFASHPPPSHPALDHQQVQGQGMPLSEFFSRIMPPARNGSPNTPPAAYDGMQTPPPGHNFPAASMSHAPSHMVDNNTAPGGSGYRITFDSQTGQYWIRCITSG